MSLEYRELLFVTRFHVVMCNEMQQNNRYSGLSINKLSVLTTFIFPENPRIPTAMKNSS
jgi:hypothetical protein